MSHPERTLKLTLAYEGTRFAGWQRQKNARTVQATLERTLQQITGSPVRVVAAGRTDSGVHAQGQVAHAVIRSTLAASTLLRALNALLPEDLLVRSIRSVPKGFHAQYSAKSKWYRYTLWNRPERPLLNRNLVHHIPFPLNLEVMQQAAQVLKGRHDFRAFHSSGRAVSSTVRTLGSLSLKTKGGTLWIDAQADGFLYHMVRRIAGFLIEVGKGRYPPSVAGQLLKGRNRVVAPTAPAKGLCLMKVRYGKIS